MSKHTPGPWVADGYDVRVLGGTYVAYTGPHHTPPDEYPKSCRLVDEANARLISAAPDLLEALNRFDVDGLELEVDEEIDITMTAEDLRILRAAIAKAKGAAHE